MLTVARTVAGAAVVAVLAAGCADAPVTPPPTAPPTAPAPQPATATVTGADQHAADVGYARAMVMHLRQGAELTAMVPGRAANPDLARLVVLMDHADVEHEGQLVGQLRAWGAPVPDEHEPADGTPGMGEGVTLERLRALSGPAFDRAWLDVMIDHHRGGVTVSRDYLDRAVGHSLVGVAASEVVVGQRQIDQMRALGARP